MKDRNNQGRGVSSFTAILGIFFDFSRLAWLSAGPVFVDRNRAYFRTRARDHKTTYLKFLPLLLKKALPTASKKSGKDLFALHCDQRDDIDEKTIREAVLKKVCDKGYTLYEDVVLVKSCFHTVGILYADIVGYLLGRIDAISMDSDLFDGISEQDYDGSGQLRKLKSSKELVNKVKTIKRYVGKLKRK